LCVTLTRDLFNHTRTSTQASEASNSSFKRGKQYEMARADMPGILQLIMDWETDGDLVTVGLLEQLCRRSDYHERPWSEHVQQLLVLVREKVTSGRVQSCKGTVHVYMHCCMHW
jgi:hypothetical protein